MVRRSSSGTPLTASRSSSGTPLRYDFAAQLLHLLCGLGQLSLQVLAGFVYSFVVTLPEAAWAASRSSSGTTLWRGLGSFGYRRAVRLCGAASWAALCAATGRLCPVGVV